MARGFRLVLQMESISASLEAAGMTGPSAAAKGAIFARLHAELNDDARGRARVTWFVPGRIEVLGKHTDYAGGRSLLCAIERGFCLAAAGRDDRRIIIKYAARGVSAALELDPNLAPAADWSTYPRTVARRLARNFPAARRGADIVFESDLPPDAGMSSSSAFMIAVFLALADVNDLRSDPTWTRTIRTQDGLAAYLAAVENGAGFGPLAGDRGVGTAGGSEDHTAILCCEAGRLSQYAFRPVRLERVVRLDPDLVFVVSASGVAAPKTGAARERYNRAAADAAHILKLWRRANPRSDASLGAGLASAPGALERMREIIRTRETADAASRLLNRLDQFYEESERIVPAAAEALARGDMAAFGAVVDESQALAERWLGNQVPETIELARSARACGALAASAFGAGFGGSVWALVSAREARDFADRWRAAYRRAFPDASARSIVFATPPGPAAVDLSSSGTTR